MAIGTHQRRTNIPRAKYWRGSRISGPGTQFQPVTTWCTTKYPPGNCIRAITWKEAWDPNSPIRGRAIRRSCSTSSPPIAQCISLRYSPARFIWVTYPPAARIRKWECTQHRAWPCSSQWRLSKNSVNRSNRAWCWPAPTSFSRTISATSCNNGRSQETSLTPTSPAHSIHPRTSSRSQLTSFTLPSHWARHSSQAWIARPH